ncbi:MAG: ADP-ribosylglycohydrolase family protein, partial [Candidatus Saccharimonas sp.]
SEHLRIYLETPKVLNFKGEIAARGWGGSTTASMERLSRGVPPSKSGEKEGSGNGILMKMAPLVYWQVARGTDDEARHRQYDELTTMTHDSDIARACTRLHGDTLHWLMQHPGATMKEFQHHALHIVEDEPNADPKGRIYRALAYPVGDFSKLVARYTTGQNGGKYGFFVPNTVAMAYDVFIASRGNYVEAVRYATNLGGDTDSIASIAGTMANAWSDGEFDVPLDFEHVHEYDRLARLSREFAQKALQLL